MRGEEGLRRVEAATDNVAAHALQDRIAHAVPLHFPSRVNLAEVILGQDEFGRETARLEIGKVLTLAKPNADGIAAGPHPHHLGHRAKQRVVTV